jgi:hypothetical protein
MWTDRRHVQEELSVAHDERRPPSQAALEHMAACAECSEFSRALTDLDALLATGEGDRSPDVAPSVLESISGRQSWWWVGAAAAIGLVIGGAIGTVSGRYDIVQAQDLDDRFQTASPSVVGLTAQLVVVERGWHSQVPERVYSGSLAYSAPESLSMELVDTTLYPSAAWKPNHVSFQMADGEITVNAAAPCPVAALPQCQALPIKESIRDRRPFGEDALIPLEIVGPGRSLSWWSGIDVPGSADLNGRTTIQVETTVAGVELLRAITDHGAWRELHPTDRVLLWLDEATMVPVRVEVFPADSNERALWQLRRGYSDPPGGEPIMIVELRDLTIGATTVSAQIRGDALSGGFIEGPVALPQPSLDSTFTPHRSGTWPLPDGGHVDVASWSDGRSWLMVEVASSWTESHLFGISTPFVRPVDLGNGSRGYLDPSGTSLAIHTAEADALVSGSVSEEAIIAAASSLGLDGLPVPAYWAEAGVVATEDLPQGTLVPHTEGWSTVGKSGVDEVIILMTGGGARTVLISQRSGSSLDPPMGPDFTLVDVRGTQGRFNAATATLEWTEDGRVIQMRSDSVGLDELLGLAEELEAR